MKKVLSCILMAIVALCFVACRGSDSGSESGSGKKANVQDNTGEYVDLGLPSGTLWGANNANEAYYTFDEAVEWFGNCLPTKEQFVELRNCCTWKWIGNGYKIIGLNGRYIFLPAVGSESDGRVCDIGKYGEYWSRTACNTPKAVNLSIGPERAKISCDGNYFRMSVRLVKK